ncbi:MAG: YkgJ family cysteine cluster protein [Candidatus Eremiobacteraeota bacterium]|nr:YkgJ family cysteine cluster protein [Candidatus Eremiobacteraeota bacterium]
MDIRQDTVIELSVDSLTVVTPSPGEGQSRRQVSYIEYTALRDAVRAVVNIVADRFGREIFADICGRCGRCCMGEMPLVTSRDIQRISQHRGEFFEDPFRSSYIEPSLTWNSRDGVLRRHEGRCVFLEQNPAGTFACTVHSVKPLACASLEPAMEICLKSPGKLITHIGKITILAGKVEITRREGQSFEKDPSLELELTEAIDALRDLLSGIPDEEPDPLWKMLGDANGVLDRIRYVFFTEGMTVECAVLLEELAEKMEALGNAAPPESESLRFLFAKVSRMTAFIAEETARMERGGEEPPRLIESLTLYPEFLSVLTPVNGTEVPRSFSYRDNPGLLSLVRQLVALIGQSQDPVVQESLWNTDATCFLCGECCCCYGVEISPYDIERISCHLEISLEETWKRYLKKGPYSWNEHIGLLLKADPSGKSDYWSSLYENVFERSSETEGAVEPPRPPEELCAPRFACVFLKSQGVREYCSIYQARPSTCSNYSPYNKPCQRVGLSERPDIHAGNIVSLTVKGKVLSLTSLHILRWKLAPLQIYLPENMQIQELCRRIDGAVAALVLRDDDAGGGSSAEKPARRD